MLSSVQLLRMRELHESAAVGRPGGAVGNHTTIDASQSATLGRVLGFRPCSNKIETGQIGVQCGASRSPAGECQMAE